jgi:hypothetical protein
MCIRPAGPVREAAQSLWPSSSSLLSLFLLQPPPPSVKYFLKMKMGLKSQFVQGLITEIS